MTAVSVLIIEDNAADAKLLEIYLQAIDGFDFEIHFAESICTAKDRSIKKKFDLILLDLGLPDGIGVSSVNKIIEISSYPAIVVMTGVYDAEIASDSIYAGAQDYIVKGDLSSIILERTITNALQRNKVKHDLEKTQETFHAIIETANDAIVTTNKDLVIGSWNRAAELMFGYKSDVALGNNIYSLFDVHDHKALASQLDNIFSEERGEATRLLEFNALNNKASLFPVELSLASWESEDGTHCSLVVRDISERLKADKMKSEFISIINHELRTPLTSLLGSLKLVNGGVVGEISEKPAALLKIAESNGEMLLLLINDILDMSKLAEGQMKLKLEKVSVFDIIKKSMVANEAYAQKYNVNYVMCGQSFDCYGDLDPIRLLQVMSNLLSNAAKFSPENGQIRIAVSERDHVFRITVTDNGPGIPVEFQSSIFNKFTQSDSSDTRKIGGTGLGLHISKMLVENMGGIIGFETEKNVATTFFIEFPFATV